MTKRTIRNGVTLYSQTSEERAREIAARLAERRYTQVSEGQERQIRKVRQASRRVRAAS